MTPRQIQTLMHRLFYGDIPLSDGYRNLMHEDGLSQDLVEKLIDDYISSDDVIVYLSAQECAYCLKSDAFSYIKRIYNLGRLRIASPDFSSRILIEPIGVGVGSNNSFKRTAASKFE